jgi:methanogenic corrinoid protein MtbC1
VERLRLLHQLVQEGHSIGGIAKLPDDDLRRMGGASSEAQGAVQHLPELRQRVLAAIERFRVDEAEHMLSRAALSTEPVRFLTEVVGPLLVEVGDRWERGELRVAQEHACSTVMRGLLFSLMRLYPKTEQRRRVVVTTPAHEAHELGAMMVAMLAAMHGWGVLYLGTNLPADEIGFAVTDTHAELLMLSISCLPAEDATREVASIVGAIPDHVRVLVGGRASAAVSANRVEIVQDLGEAERVLRR